MQLLFQLFLYMLKNCLNYLYIFLLINLSIITLIKINRAFYRIVATDSRNPRDGRFIEIVGTYDPLTNPETVKIDVEKVEKWVNNGAKLTDTVKSLLVRQGIKLGSSKKAE